MRDTDPKTSQRVFLDEPEMRLVKLRGPRSDMRWCSRWIPDIIRRERLYHSN